MTVSAITAAGTSTAQSELAKYQQKLAADLAAKATAKAAEQLAGQQRDQVITEDRTAVSAAQQVVQSETEQARTMSTSGFQSKLDISI
jgi:hypothetical protein